MPYTINMIGLGYIGLPTALVLTRAGHAVQGVDINETVVSLLSSGLLHIDEPGLEDLLKEAISKGSFRPSTALLPAEFHIIAVPTPMRDDKSPNMAHVFAAGDALAQVLKADDTVILESTSPVGSTEELERRLLAARPDLAGQIHFAYCPERVLPGRILHELIHNDRIVGGTTPQGTAKAAAFYRSFVEKGEVLETNARTAELVKLSENAFRDINIAFANELDHVADKLGINVFEAIRLANHHPRVNILTPGPGVGGHCIAVDPWFIVSAAPDVTPLIQSARAVNDGKPLRVAALVESTAENLSRQLGRKARIACLGLTYKNDVDDLRESPALAIAKALSSVHGEAILACDPLVEPKQKLGLTPELGTMTLTPLETVLETADLFVMLVPHAVFRDLHPERIGNRPVVDTVGLWRGK